MIQTYDDLYDVVSQALNDAAFSEVCMQVADNKSCQLIHTPSGRKVVLMLARLGDEFRVGFAYFEGRSREAGWIDDVVASGVTPTFVHQLIESHLINALNA